MPRKLPGIRLFSGMGENSKKEVALFLDIILFFEKKEESLVQ
jgi:hypothetical protein